MQPPSPPQILLSLTFGNGTHSLPTRSLAAHSSLYYRTILISSCLPSMGGLKGVRLLFGRALVLTNTILLPTLAFLREVVSVLILPLSIIDSGAQQAFHYRLGQSGSVHLLVPPFLKIVRLPKCFSTPAPNLSARSFAGSLCTNVHNGLRRYIRPLEP